MSAFITAVLFAVGVGVWIYTKLARQTGYGNEKNAYIGAAIASGLAFLIAFSILAMIM